MSELYFINIYYIITILKTKNKTKININNKSNIKTKNTVVEKSARIKTEISFRLKNGI